MKNALRATTALTALLTLNPASVLAKKDSKKLPYTVKTEFKTQYTKLDSEPNKANEFGVDIKADIKYRLLEDLNFEFTGGAKAETGNSDSINDNNEFSASNKIYISNAALKWNPFNVVTLKAGALSLKEYSAPLLMGWGPFIGAKEELKFKYNNLKLNAFALQSTPSANNISNQVYEVEQGDPTFFAEGIAAKLKFDDIEFSASTMHFAFDKLSNNVAAASVLFGNEGDVDVSSMNGDLKYKFIGWYHQAETQFNILDTKVYLGLDLINNTDANEHNEGHLYYVGAIFPVHGDWTLETEIELFENEANTSPGYYNNKWYGHNNKKGTHYYVDLENKVEGFGIRAHFSDIQILNEELNNVNKYQGDEKIISISLRKFYELF